MRRCGDGDVGVDRFGGAQRNPVGFVRLVNGVDGVGNSHVKDREIACGARRGRPVASNGIQGDLVPFQYRIEVGLASCGGPAFRRALSGPRARFSPEPASVS